VDVSFLQDRFVKFGFELEVPPGDHLITLLEPGKDLD
jgi:hypothetical protein